MTKRLYFTLCLYLISIIQLFAQLTITYPLNRAVFQRNQQNQAIVYIAGYVTGNPTSIEARFVNRTTSGVENIGAEIGWQVISGTSKVGNFYGSLVASGGWYQLEVRAKSGNSITHSASVERVGIGEVFIVAGQSNATGSNELPSGPGATDDRVNSVDFQNYNPLNNPSIQDYSNVQMPYPTYTHLESTTRLAPFGNNAWNWGKFGDALVAKLGVPVMIFNAGWTATSSQNWKESIDINFETQNGFGYRFPRGLPFGHLRLALNYYASILGARAILWHQGESDNLDSRSREDYRSNLMTIIESSRTISNKPNLAWVIARASRYNVNGSSRTWEPTIQAQNDIINADAYAFAGPATDDVTSTDLRRDGVHFEGEGLNWLGQEWSNSISTDFLNNTVPYPAAVPHSLQITGNSTSGAFELMTTGTFPHYKWTTIGDFNTTLGSGPVFQPNEGSYLLQTKDANNNVVLSPEVHLSLVSLPVSLTSFIGKASDSFNQLQWSTSAETAASHFDIESSVDGSIFNTIGQTTAVGESSTTKNYTFEDSYASQHITYYRLKSVDLDGSFTYSPIVSVYNTRLKMATIYPNPFRSNIVIEHTNPIYKVEIVDVAGNSHTLHYDGRKKVELNLSHLPVGSYFVKLNQATYKVVKSE